MYIERPVGYLSLVRSVHWEEVCRSAREQRFVSDNWLSMSEPLCSTSSMVSLWYVHITAGMASSAGQLYHVLFLPTHVPVILSHFDSSFWTSMSSSETTLERYQQRKQERRTTKIWYKRATRCTHCYLTHAHSTCCHFLVLSRGVVKGCCQGVLSRGVVKECCQQVLSRSVVSWFYMWQLYTHSSVLWLKPSRAHLKENAVPCSCQY